MSPVVSPELSLKKMFWVLWITYASFYLLRVNISVAMPAMMEEFSWSKTDMGLILSSLFAMYAIGQFINGQLGDKLSSRKIITIGLITSALLNAAFGVAGGAFGLLIVIWGLNGYFQSMGWAPTVKAMATWFPAAVRGKIAGRLGTSYIIGGAASWLLAGAIMERFNWRFVFFVPAVICAGLALHWYVQTKSAPEDKYIGLRNTLKLTLTNKYVWFTALALFGLNIVRFGFMSWAPTYMFEEQGATISVAAYKAVAFPVAGGLGAIFAGWASDRFRRVPVAFTMLVLLAVFCFLYRVIPGENWVLSLVILLVIGFLTFGPHVLIVAVLPVDLGSRKAASSVTGFVDCVGYAGATLTGIGSGWLIERFGWGAAFYFWIGGAVMALAMIALVWRFERSSF